MEKENTKEVYNDNNLSDETSYQLSGTIIYDDIKKGAKKFLRLVFYFFIFVIVYYIFDLWVVAGAIIFSIPFFVILKNIVKTPYKTFLEVDYDSREINLIVMGIKPYKEFKRVKKFSPFNNAEVIKQFWFNDINEWEFLGKITALKDISELFSNWLEKYASYLEKYDIMAYKKANEWLNMLNNELINMPDEIEVGGNNEG